MLPPSVHTCYFEHIGGLHMQSLTEHLWVSHGHLGSVPEVYQSTFFSVCSWNSNQKPSGIQLSLITQTELMLHPEMMHWAGMEPVPPTWQASK